MITEYAIGMRQLLLISCLLLTPTLYATERLDGWCEKGSTPVYSSPTAGAAATQISVQRSYPACTVTVYVSGSGGTRATLYSDSTGTALGNPFTSDTTGHYTFYTNGCVDVQMTGGGLSSPVTVQSVCYTNIDSNGFAALGNTTVNDSTALGYVLLHIDQTFLNQDNEARGVSSVVRAIRTTQDEQTAGWDQFGLVGAVVLGAMNLPADPIYGTPYIRGQQKAFQSELYYQPPVTPYTANIGTNYLASLSQVASGVTLNTWAGLTVGQPGGFGGGGGSVVNGYGVWIQDLHGLTYGAPILTPTTAAAVEIEGLSSYGRIWWTCNAALRPCLGSSIYSPVLGTLEMSASTVVQTATTVGFRVGGVTANAGIAAGSYAIGTNPVPVIDSGRNASFAELSISGVTTLSGNLTVNITGSTQCVHVNSAGVMSGTGSDCGSGGGGGGGNPFSGSVTANTSLTAVAGYYVGTTGIIQCDSTGCPTISIGNVYNVAAAGTISTVNGQHVSAGTGSNGGFWLGVGGATQNVISGSGDLTLLTVTGSGNQCLHAGPTGVVTGTGTECGSGGGGGGSATGYPTHSTLIPHPLLHARP